MTISRLLSDLSQEPSVPLEAYGALRELAAFAEPLKDDASSWIGALPWLEEQIQRIETMLGNSARNSTATGTPLAPDLAWWAGETAARLRGVRAQVENLIPWALPEYWPLIHSGAPLESITLASLPAARRDMENQVAEFLQNDRASGTERSAAQSLQRRFPFTVDSAARLSQALQRLARDADQLVNEMDFRFLYNPKRRLFSTGYNVSAAALDPYYYDLLASEARTAVFIAAAKGEVNQEAWFRLGRSFTSYLGERLLFSWSGTMFEYLMPALWMRSLADTIMDQTLRAAVRCQQEYARRHDVPWGMSEAAFSERDPQGTYGYRAFGVPGLALDPHAPDNLVISPYSSFLALLVEPDAAIRNLMVMRKMGCLGSRGFYESCDFSPAQKPAQGNFEIIRCWMAHHQGMSLVALSNLLNEFSIQKWFHREPRVKAVELLLHEKVALSVQVATKSPRPAEQRRPAAGLRALRSRFASCAASRSSNGLSGDIAQRGMRLPNSGAP